MEHVWEGQRMKARQEAGRHRSQKAPKVFLGTQCSESKEKLEFLGRRSDLITSVTKSISLVVLVAMTLNFIHQSTYLFLNPVDCC